MFQTWNNHDPPPSISILSRFAYPDGVFEARSGEDSLEFSIEVLGTKEVECFREELVRVLVNLVIIPIHRLKQIRFIRYLSISLDLCVKLVRMERIDYLTLLPLSPEQMD